MKNIKYLLLLSLFFVMFACGPSAPNFKLEGHIDNMKTGRLFIYNENSSTASFDTLYIENSKFSYEGVSDGITQFFIVYPNAVEQVVFAEGGKTLKYEASLNDLKNYTIEGSETNEIMNEFRQKTSDVTDNSQIRTIATDFIKKYPDTPVAIYLLNRYFAMADNLNIKRLEYLYNVIKTVQPDNETVQFLEGKLKQLKALHLGAKVPSVKMVTIKDDTVDICKYKNTYALYCFWATWLNTSDEVFENIRGFYQKNKNKCDLKVYAISLDGAKYQWQEFVRSDSVNTTHCYDGLSWESPAVTKFGITSLPYYVLADKNKKITAFGSNLDALQDGLEPTTP